MLDIRSELLNRIPDSMGKWISCDAGWDWILFDLHGKLKYLDFNYEIHQVKEKFGTLRFYYESLKTQEVVLSLMDDAVSAAERLSASTCEICGNTSTISDQKRGINFDRTVGLKSSHNGDPNGWLKTLCDGCASPLGYAEFSLKNLD